MGYYIFIGSSLLVLAFVTSLNAKCDKETTDFHRCLAEFTNLTDFSRGDFNATALESYCQSRAQKEIRCVQNLIEDCQRSERSRAQRFLDNLLNVDNVVRSVNVVCNNTDAVRVNQDCIRRYEDDVKTCAAREDASLKKNGKALVRQAPTRGIDYYEKESAKLLCKYAEGMKVCFRPFDQNCAKKVGDIFIALGDALTPPLCSIGKQITGIIGIITLTFMVFLSAVNIIL